MRVAVVEFASCKSSGKGLTDTYAIYTTLEKMSPKIFWANQWLSSKADRVKCAYVTLRGTT